MSFQHQLSTKEIGHSMNRNVLNMRRRIINPKKSAHLQTFNKALSSVQMHGHSPMDRRKLSATVESHVQSNIARQQLLST